MPKKNAAKTCTGRGRGRGGRRDNPESPLPSSTSQKDAEGEAARMSSPSPTRSVAGSDVSRESSVASTSSTRSTLVKKKRSKRSQFSLLAEEEQLMCDFIRENAMLWDVKLTDYHRVDKLTKIWDDQAKIMNRSVQHIQGWFKSLRDTHTRLNKKKSGDGAVELTEREIWIKNNFDFLRSTFRYRPEPVRSVKAKMAKHCGDDVSLEDAEATSANIIIDDKTQSSRRKNKRDQEDELLLNSLQQRVHESGELLKSLTQPQPVTASSTFANYVRDSLVTMSKRKFRKARTRINTILSELMDEDSDEEEPPQILNTVTQANVGLTSASATFTP